MLINRSKGRQTLYCNNVVIEKNKKGNWKRLNWNKLGTLTTFRKNEDEDILHSFNLILSTQLMSELKYYTYLRNCFQDYQKSKRYLHD